MGAPDYVKLYTTEQLTDGILAANAQGRAKMADGFFAADATSRAKIVANFLTTMMLNDGILSADATGRAKMAANFLQATHFPDLVITQPKLGTDVGSPLSRSELRTAANFRHEAPLIARGAIGTAVSSRSITGCGIRVWDAGFSDGAIWGFLGAHGYAPSGLTTALVAGNKIIVEALINVTGFSGYGANILGGIALVLGQPVATDFSKTTTTGKIVVGVDSAGDIFIATADGAAASVLDTGANAVSGTPFKVRIEWTVGTNVSVSINNAAPVTKATNLPTLIDAWMAGSNGFAVAEATRNVEYRGGSAAFQVS